MEFPIYVSAPTSSLVLQLLLQVLDLLMSGQLICGSLHLGNLALKLQPLSCFSFLFEILVALNSTMSKAFVLFC